MKKITLLLMACCMSLMAFAAGGDITYVLNGGVTNDYGWQNKSDMFDAFMHEANPTWDWKTLEYYMEQTDPLGSPNICSGLLSCVILDTNAEKWGWLKTYILDVTTEQSPGPAELTSNLADAAWRYAVGAFFVDWKRDSWPISANFASAGQPAVFMPAWGHGFAGPDSYDGTEEIILPMPYKEGESFLGWYDNPEFTGDKIVSIPEGDEGDKTFYAKFGEYIPTCKEVGEMPAGESVKTIGVVTYVNGTTVYIQDASAGLMIEFAAAESIVRGDQITVTGTTAALGDYKKLTGATLVEKETASLPTAPGTLLTALAGNMFKYVLIEGVKITAITGSNITLSEGANSIVLVAEGVTFAVNTKVNVKAVVTYTSAISLVGIADDVSLAPGPTPDAAVYAPMGDDGQYTLTSKWLVSANKDNLSANSIGGVDQSRGMVVKDGKMYFTYRDAGTHTDIRLNVVDGATGIRLDDISFTATDVFEGSYPFNDIKLDSKGNFISSNLPTSNATLIKVWILDIENPKESRAIINEKMNDYPDFADIDMRLDYFGVYGDVENDAIIMAASSKTMDVYKWTFTDGVKGDPELIILDTETPGTSFTDVTSNGSEAAMVFPVEDGYFYVDMFNTTPALFDQNGIIVDGFYNYPGSDVSITKAQNGLVEFEVGGEYFLITGYTEPSGSPRSSFRMFKFKDENKEFADIEPMWVFPTAGLGGNTNGNRVAISSVEVDEATSSATIYIYYGANGYGAYTFRTDGGVGIKNVKSGAIDVFAFGNEIRLSENANIQVFNVMGQLVQSAQGVSSVTVSANGIYVVSVRTLSGEIVTKKVVIK